MKDSMTQIERNITIGNLLGDGSLALYGRSKNAYYREHGGEKLRRYRQWKAFKLKDLSVKFDMDDIYGGIRSRSLPIFTELHNMFYINRIKTLTADNIKLLDHPIGLACLYMDDGTLVIDSTKRASGKYIFPRIAIYTLSFAKEENELLINHIKEKFDINFKLKKWHDGKNYILELNKQSEIIKFINLVKEIILEIPCMYYKIDLEKNLKLKQQKLIENNTAVDIAKLSSELFNYTLEEENIIIRLKITGTTDKEIAQNINKSYWGTVDKIRRLRKEGKL